MVTPKRNVRVEDDTWNKITAIAAGSRRLTTSEVVRQALEAYLAMTPGERTAMLARAEAE